MSNYRWAVVSFYVYDDLLQCRINADDFDSVLKAEDYRVSFLKKCPDRNPQNIKVIQYAAD